MSYPPTHRRRVQSPTVRARAGSEIQAAEKRPSQSARRTRGGGVLPLVLFSPARAASGRAHQGGREVGSASPCPVAMPALKGEDPTFSEVARLFDKPIAEAQQQLGLCGARIKQIIRDNGVARWPFRKYQALVTKVRQPRQPPPNQPRQKGRQGGPARACARACTLLRTWLGPPGRRALCAVRPGARPPRPSTSRFSTLDTRRSLLACRALTRRPHTRPARRLFHPPHTPGRGVLRRRVPVRPRRPALRRRAGGRRQGRAVSAGPPPEREGEAAGPRSGKGARQAQAVGGAGGGGGGRCKHVRSGGGARCAAKARALIRASDCSGRAAAEAACGCGWVGVVWCGVVGGGRCAQRRHRPAAHWHLPESKAVSEAASWGWGCREGDKQSSS